MLEWVQTQIETNHFFNGAIAATVITSALVYLKGVPRALWSFSKRKLCASIAYTNTNPEFPFFFKWVIALPTFKGIKTIEPYTNRYASPGETCESYLIPQQGVYFGWLGWRPIMLVTNRETNQNGGFTWHAKMDIWFLNRKGAQDIVDKISKTAKTPEDCLRIYSLSDYGDASFKSRSLKPMASVFLPGDQQNKILDDAKAFIARFDKMKAKGLIPKRVYLFHGPPGTGKTSLSLALASELGWPIYRPNLKRDSFKANWNVIPKQSIISLEDIDALPISTTREDSSESSVTLADLLSVLDGADSLSECIVILTTNHIEKVDAAVLREGRIDKNEYIPEADFTCAVSVAKYYLDCPEEDARNFILSNFGERDKYSAAAVQELAVKNL